MSSKRHNRVIACDLDGVLCSFNTAFRELILKHTGVELPPISDTYPDEWGYHKKVLRSKQIDGLWVEIRNSDFWETLDPLVDTPELLWLLRNGAPSTDVYFITNRRGSRAKAQTEYWLRSQGWPNPTVLLSANKGPICQGLDVDIFIDDKPSNCWDVKVAVPKANVYLVDRPYNRSSEDCLLMETKGIVRVKSVLEALEGKGVGVAG